jgi:hypothetical protein
VTGLVVAGPALVLLGAVGALVSVTAASGIARAGLAGHLILGAAAGTAVVETLDTAADPIGGAVQAFRALLAPFAVAPACFRLVAAAATVILAAALQSCALVLVADTALVRVAALTRLAANGFTVGSTDTLAAAADSGGRGRLLTDATSVGAAQSVVSAGKIVPKTAAPLFALHGGWADVTLVTVKAAGQFVVAGLAF